MFMQLTSHSMPSPPLLLFSLTHITQAIGFFHHFIAYLLFLRLVHCVHHLASFAVVVFSASFFNFIPVFWLYLSQFVFFNTITFVFVYFSVFAVSILLSCWPALDGGDFHLHTTIYDILRPDLIQAISYIHNVVWSPLCIAVIYFVTSQLLLCFLLALYISVVFLLITLLLTWSSTCLLFWSTFLISMNHLQSTTIDICFLLPTCRVICMFYQFPHLVSLVAVYFYDKQFFP